MARLFCLALTAVCSSTQFVLAAEPFPGAGAFFAKNCLTCHNADDPNGNLDFGALKYNSDNRDNFARWVKIHDRIKAGEMPPADDVGRRRILARSASQVRLGEQLSVAESVRFYA